MNKIIYNFAVIRFLPYRESGEFVNIGVAMMCPQINHFDFLVERRKRKRITNFFPELDYKGIFAGGVKHLEYELNRNKAIVEADCDANQGIFNFKVQHRIDAFQNLVAPTEDLFQFSEIGTGITHDPKPKLRELFDYYVERQFIHQKERHEDVMKKRLVATFDNLHLRRFYELDKRIGTDDYHVTLPLVHLHDGKAQKAIKPLDLNLDETTSIYEKGLKWEQRIEMLRQFHCLPEKILFAVEEPTTRGLKQNDAFKFVLDKLHNCGAEIANFQDTDRIINFANILE